ncbi:MAG: flavin reductase family protein [Chloroflexi bacterium]|nr:flavin reductase family protein [Chloroflexota bacterium]
MPVDSETFKAAMARFTAGVTVVTTLHENEIPIGVTATAFSSVSLEPPLVLICIGKGLFTLDCIEACGVFAVNFLKRDQLEWGQLFAGMIPNRDDDRFAEIAVETAETGAPVLPGVLGWVDCQLYNKIDAGDHVVFIGEVLAAHVSDGMPLAYFDRQWVTVTPVSRG